MKHFRKKCSSGGVTVVEASGHKESGEGGVEMGAGVERKRMRSNSTLLPSFLLLQCLLLSSAVTNAQYVTPTNGSFFYSQLKYD